MHPNLANLDPRRLLAQPWVYRGSQGLIRGEHFYRVLTEEYLCAVPGNRVLDVGCGPAEVLAYLPEVDYTGLDQSGAYIDAARARFGSRGRFLQQPLDATRVEALGAGGFDIVLASGLLHHLDDDEAKALLELAYATLRPGGRLVTLDGCFVPDQSAFVRALLRWDRGRFVREVDAYLELARPVFGDVGVHLRHDLLRIPYTLVLLECQRPTEPATGHPETP